MWGSFYPDYCMASSTAQKLFTLQKHSSRWQGMRGWALSELHPSRCISDAAVLSVECATLCCLKPMDNPHKKNRGRQHGRVTTSEAAAVMRWLHCQGCSTGYARWFADAGERLQEQFHSRSHHWRYCREHRVWCVDMFLDASHSQRLITSHPHVSLRICLTTTLEAGQTQHAIFINLFLTTKMGGDPIF
jgi:hypothetical protein